MKWITAVLSLLTLAAQRLWHQRLLMACLLAGLLVAVGLLAGIPLYADAVQNRLLQGELTDAGTYRPPFAFLWRYVGAWNGDISWDEYQPINSYLTQQAVGVVDLPLDSQASRTIRHVATAKLRLFPGEAVNFTQNEPLLWANVGFITDLATQIELVEGVYPSETAVSNSIEIIIHQDTAEQLGLQLGEAYTLFSADSDNSRLPLRIVGVWQPRDLADPVWFYQPDAFTEMLLTSEGQFSQLVAPALDAAVSTAVWYQIYDGGRIRPATVDRFLQNVAIVEARATALLDGTTLDASPLNALQDFGRSNNLLTLTLTIFSIPIVGIVLYFISLIASMVVARDASEIAVWRSRGMTRPQIVGVYLLEGLLVGGLGLSGGLWLAMQLARLMGRTRTFLDPTLFSGRTAGELTPVLSITAVSYALVGVGLALLALLIPALIAAAHTIVTMRVQQARSLLAPLWQRYFLDVLLLLPPLYGWYQLEQQGTIALLGSGRDPFSNPLLFLVPVLFCFSLALVALRFFALLMSGLAWLAEKLPGVTLLLTLRQLARAATQYSGPLLLLSLTISLASFTASMAVTFDEHLTDQIYYQIGADLNLAELGENTEGNNQQSTANSQQPTTSGQEDEDEPRWLFLPVTDHLLVDGVQAAARVGEYTAVSAIGGRQQSGHILGVDRVDFAQVAFFRPDFANNEALGGLMNRLAVQRDHILVSQAFMNQNSLQVGDPLRLTIGAADEFADAAFIIAGPLNLFPTQYVQDGPFFVANLDYLHEALGGAFPYNVWLQTETAVSTAQIVDDVRALGFAVVTSQDARDRILQEQTRPERQGLFGLLSVGFLAAALLTVLGFLLYAIVSFRQRMIQLGMLRAIGLSVTQMAAYLAGEQALLIMAGVVVGSGLGVSASRLFIPFLQVGGGAGFAEKTAVTPPFVVQIAWEQLGTIYALFGIMFIVAVLILIILVARMRIFEAIKLGEAV